MRLVADPELTVYLPKSIEYYVLELLTNNTV
jgi:hypothetical protein